MGCGKKPWVPLMGVTGYVSYAPALVARQLGGIQSIPRTLGITQFTGIYKGVTSEILEDIKQDWKSLVFVKKETGLRSPTVSERYPKWRNGGVTRADPISKLVGTRRKRVDCEEELREQVRQLQAELKTKEELSASLERQLTEEKAARKVAEEERDVVGQDWIKVMENLEMQKTINQDVMGKAKHWEELAAKTQAALDSHMADIDEFKNQAEIEAFNTKEELRMGMHNHKIEVEALKSKLTREKLKTVQLIESRKMLEQHNQTLDTSNNFLSRNNLIHTERIKELQDQIDRAATEAHLLRVEARQVGGDIMKYRRSLDNTDLFLRAVANKGSALAPVLD
jgi:chromosome segregation ATPase